MDDFRFPEETESSQFEDLRKMYDSLAFDWRAAGFKRIKCAKPQATGSDNRLTLELTDGTSYPLTDAELEALSNGDKATETLQQDLAAYNVYVHKNRNGRWATATGQEPTVWPEDEV